MAKNNHPLPGGNKNRKNKDKPNWMSAFLIIIVTGVWVTSFIVGLFNDKYQIPEQVNFLFSSVVGGLLLNATAKRKDSNDDE